MNLRDWAARWGVPLQAVLELESALGVAGNAPPLPEAEGKSESYVQSAVRLEAAQYGVWLTRNNVGVLMDATGRPVRYGLANESPGQNKVIKSADLIGIRPITVEPRHVGTIIGQLVSRECKHAGWHYTGTGREVQQRAWIDFIIAKGGDAAFAAGPGSFHPT